MFRLQAAVIMYVRFVTPLIDSDTRVETGIFQSYFRLLELDCPQWVIDQIDDHWEWFGEHLAIPPRRTLYFGRRSSLHGVCWFKGEANEAIRRTRHMACLFEEGGLPVRFITWRGPVQAIWSDDHQIVTAPDARMPRGFH